MCRKISARPRMRQAKTPPHPGHPAVNCQNSGLSLPAVVPKKVENLRKSKLSVARSVLSMVYEYAYIQSQPEEWRICEALAFASQSLRPIPFWCAGRRHHRILCRLCRRIDLPAVATLSAPVAAKA